MKYFSAAQFKSAIKSGQKPDDCILTKASIGVPEVTGERTVKFTISTDCVDRDNVIDRKRLTETIKKERQPYGRTLG